MGIIQDIKPKQMYPDVGVGFLLSYDIYIIGYEKNVSYNKISNHIIKI